VRTLIAACVLLAGCTGLTPPTGTTVVLQPSVELTDVPFFPQSRYQCGPAALATALGASGVSVSPDALADRVYVPGRKGSFQVELAAAARHYGRIPYPVRDGLDGLYAELAAGRPVLVLQNLAFSWAPAWHYAVVVGSEPDRQRLVLRSGRTERQQMRLKSFDRTWALADRWGLVMLRPGELPSRGSPHDYLAAIVAASHDLTSAEQTQALAAGIAAWPEDADLTFAAANLAHGQGDLPQAARLYRQVLVSAPDHVGALNNLADLLSVTGCQSEALILVEQGIRVAGEGSALAGVLAATRAEIVARQADPTAEGKACRN